ncbi:30S ribosome-binding factor RbfA [Patescibacteria group bacterium]|nr:30S ribosome-binding factor RbfA [Patescibacteria group bacterium]
MSRSDKVNSLIKRELAALIPQEIELPKGCIVTVSEVEASLDVRHARAYISVMPKDKEEDVMELLGTHIYDIQQNLNKKLVMRHVPKIRFMIDHREEHAARIEEIISSEYQDDGNK